MNNSPSNLNGNSYEPVFLNARHEAIITLFVWIAGLAWTMGYCLLTGYDVPADQMKATLGIPNWIFWGVLVPWVLIILFTIWFGLFYIADDELAQGQHNLPPETKEVSQ